MAQPPAEEYKKLESEQLVGLELSIEELTNLICDSITVKDIDIETNQELECKLPSAIGLIIVSFLRIQDRQAVKVGDELWVRMDSKRFRSTVGYMQASYPWAFKGRKLEKQFDAYLEGLELWQRYRVKYDLISNAAFNDFDGQLKILKLIVKALPNRAKKHASSDLVTLYNSYNLFNSFGAAKRDIIGSGVIKQEDFEADWELYGDNVENLATHLNTAEINEWRTSIEKIQYFKQQLVGEIMAALYPHELKNPKVRKIHLSTDMFRDRTKYIYDIFIGPEAVLFQRVHSD